MYFYTIISLLIIAASTFAIINQRFLKLPNNVGVMLIAILISIGVLISNSYFPDRFSEIIKVVENVDFSEVLIDMLLSFLLFAGTVQIRIKDLKEQQLPVILYATIGVLISTFTIGSLLFLCSKWVGINIPLTHWLIFGALISPTDPVSVLGMTKQAKMPASLQTKIAGESLFNDGVALILFVTILHTVRNPNEGVSIIQVLKIIGIEVFGAIAIGVALGFIGLRVLAKTPDPKVHVMFTLALVMGGQLLSTWLHVSAPLMMVTAGIFLGNYGKKYAMSDETTKYLDIFWELVDEILNVVLFALIGFQLLIIEDYDRYWKISLLAIAVVLVARFIAILLPSLIVRLKQKMPMRVILFLTWGGLRGGISLALALSLSYRQHKNMFVFITFCVVVFSVLVQGLSLERLFLKEKKGSRKTEIG